MRKAFRSDRLKAAPGCMEYMIEVMNKLENDKGKLIDKYGDELFNDVETIKAILRRYALAVFDQSSHEFKEGKADRNTGILLYASCFRFI